ncbi:cupin domain-containing protein [Paraburkholderia sp. CNPSo 3157]|uniref:Cupin domain-containing protein n=1 Tax=Paraburkholderia franconis TaxID=2654983 RepID=A0A7X1TET9_9BURK|nr:cupin domain-containing protein [Paraburkholderia franconis]MPW16680.1 cupin domain-containing protein [Paraburkholderia franconis]
MNAARRLANVRHVRTLATLSLLALAPLAALPTRPAVQWLAAMCSTPLLSDASPSSDSARRPATTVRPLSCEPLAHVPGKSVTTAIVDYPPRAFTPAHRHPGSVTAFVIEGTVRSQLAGGPAIDYRSGQTWFEPPGTLHEFAENPDPARPAKLLAVFVTDSDCGPLVLPP